MCDRLLCHKHATANHFHAKNLNRPIFAFSLEDSRLRKLCKLVYAVLYRMLLIPRRSEGPTSTILVLHGPVFFNHLAFSVVLLSSQTPRWRPALRKPSLPEIIGWHSCELPRSKTSGTQGGTVTQRTLNTGTSAIEVYHGTSWVLELSDCGSAITARSAKSRVYLLTNYKELCFHFLPYDRGAKSYALLVWRR